VTETGRLDIDDARAQFGPFEGHVWLNCAHQGPLPRVAQKAAQAAIREKALPYLIEEQSFRRFPDRLAGGAFGGGVRSSMPMDAYRKDDDFIVHFDFPGVDSDSIDPTLQDNVLTVKAERHFDFGEGCPNDRNWRVG
jgi:hypothetical protein